MDNKWQLSWILYIITIIYNHYNFTDVIIEKIIDKFVPETVTIHLRQECIYLLSSHLSIFSGDRIHKFNQLTISKNHDKSGIKKIMSNDQVIKKIN